MQVVNALIKADKDFELLVVPRLNHKARLSRPRWPVAAARVSLFATCWEGTANESRTEARKPPAGAKEQGEANTADHRNKTSERQHQHEPRPKTRIHRSGDLTTIERNVRIRDGLL